MRVVAAALLGLTASGLVLALPARAQNLGDVGRVLQDALVPRQDPDRERRAYEQGRQDQVEVRRQEEARRQEEFRRQNAGRERGEYRREGERYEGRAALQR